MGILTTRPALECMLAALETRAGLLDGKLKATSCTEEDQLARTPEAIYELCLKYFPTARAKVVPDEPVRLEVSLDHGLPKISMINAIVKKSFEAMLRELQLQKIAAVTCRVPFRPSAINVDEFSAREVLLGECKGFARRQYENEGKKCAQALKSYLEDPTALMAPTVIKELGLAPDQLARKLEDDDVAVFEELFKDLKPTDPILANFRLRYREIVLAIASKIERKKLERPITDPHIKILESLQSKMVGQKQAIELVAGALSRSKAGSNHIFLFVGPTGVGKTELAKAAASLRDGRMLTFNMEKFREEYKVSSFWGSPPGHVGSTAKPRFAVELEKYPEALKRLSDKHFEVSGIVLLFDEFEKAHPNLQQSFLTLFDEGYCECEYTGYDRSSGGTEEAIKIRYTLRNCIIISTSNAHQDKVVLDFAAKRSPDAIAENFKRTCAENYVPGVRGFAPELLGRFKPIIPFGPIHRGEEFRRAIYIHLNPFTSELKKEIGCREVSITNMAEILVVLEEKLYGTGIDLRRIKTFLEVTLNRLQKYVYSWGEIKNIKLEIVVEDRRIFIKVMTFSPILNDYIPTPGIEKIPISE